MARVVPKFQLEFTEKEWINWKKLLLNYVITQRARTPEEKFAHLVIQGGDDIVMLLDNLPPRNPPNVGLSISLIANDEFQQALIRLDDHFELKSTPFAMVSMFRDLKQGPQESVKLFAVRVREAAKKCDFMDEERQILEQLIRGMKDNNIKRKALCNAYNSVEDVVKEALANETLASTSSGPISEINWVSTSKQVTCYFCRQKGHTCRDCNKLKMYECKKCKKKGHTESYCKSKAVGVPKFKKEQPKQWQNRRSNVNNIQESVEEQEPHGSMNIEEEYIFNLDACCSIYAKVGGIRQEFIVDTGARSNIVPLVVWNLLKEKQIKIRGQTNVCNKTFKTYGSEEALKIVGVFEAKLELNDESSLEEFYVTEKGSKCLLGQETAIKRNIIVFNNPNVRSNE